MNLSLCNIDSLWKDVIATQKAKVISRKNQDFVCLLTDFAEASDLSLDINSLSCLDEIGSLIVNQPPSGTFTINLKPDIQNRIGQLICNTSTSLNISSSTPDTSFSTALISCNDLTISGPCFIQPFSIYVVNNSSFSNISGSINNLNQTNKNIEEVCLFDSVRLRDSNINVGNITLNNSFFSNCSIRSSKTITIDNSNNDNFQNTLISGNIVNINNFEMFDIPVIADSTGNLNNVNYIIGLIDAPTIKIEDAYVINGLEANKTNNMIIKTKSALTSPSNNLPYNGRARINQYLSPSGSINIEGLDNEDNSVVLTPSCNIVSSNILVDNFINYGTIVGERITLKNGINYGLIRGRFIDNQNTINNGTITGII